jgi:hypothetical protein
MISPVFEGLAAEFSGAEFYKVDVDSQTVCQLHHFVLGICTDDLSR